MIISHVPSQKPQKESTLKEKTAKGLFWSFFDRGGQQVFAFLFSIILANILNPSDFGLIGVLSIFIATSTTLIDSGFGNALIKDKEEPTPSAYSTIFLFNLSISVALYFILFFSSHLIAKFFENEILETLSKLVFLPIIINALALVQHLKLVRKVDFKSITRINLTSLIISGSVAVCCAYKGLGVYSLAIQTIFYSLLRTSLLWIKTRWIPNFSFKKNIIGHYYAYSSKIALVGIINVVFDYLYNIFIGKFYSMSKSGYYTYAKKYNDIPTGAISLSVQDVTFPILSKLADDNERLIRAFRKAIKTAAFLLFPCLWGLMSISPSFFAVFLKPDWEPSVPILQLLCITSPFYALCITNDNLILAKGQSSLFLKITIIKKALLIICLFFTLKYGIMTMIAGLAFYNFLSFIISIIATKKVVNCSPLYQLKDIFPYILISLIMSLTVYSLSFIITNKYILFPIQVIIGVFVYWFLCKSFGSKIYNDVIVELKNRLA